MTDPGLARTTNQDSFVVRPDLGLFVVADGVARSAAGALAAALAVRAVERSFELSTRRDARPRPASRDERPRLVRSFARANASVREAGRRHPQHAGMTTTLAALVVAGDRVVLGHVGDSRIYRVRGRAIHYGRHQWHDRELEELTTDHTVGTDVEWRAAHPEDDELPDPAELQLLTRSIGLSKWIRVTTRLEKVEPGDTFMLSTDGIHGVLNDSLLEAPLRYVGSLRNAAGAECKRPVPQMQCAWLIDRVKQRGAPDNATVIVVRFRKGRCRWTTESSAGCVVHAPPHNLPWVDTRRARREEEDEGEDEE
jgi:PPM family protein phosphatase